jgi:hypothetical protein
VYGASADKATRKALQKLQTVALAAASKGDEAAAHAAIKVWVLSLSLSLSLSLRLSPSPKPERGPKS